MGLYFAWGHETELKIWCVAVWSSSAGFVLTVSTVVPQRVNPGVSPTPSGPRG